MVGRSANGSSVVRSTRDLAKRAGDTRHAATFLKVPRHQQCSASPNYSSRRSDQRFLSPRQHQPPASALAAMVQGHFSPSGLRLCNLCFQMNLRCHRASLWPALRIGLFAGWADGRVVVKGRRSIITSAFGDCRGRPDYPNTRPLPRFRCSGRPYSRVRRRLPRLTKPATPAATPIRMSGAGAGTDF